MKTVLFLIGSNIFMTIAWYRHLKATPDNSTPLIIVILLSWLIALPEYALQVPGNRAGKFDHGFTVTQLKVIQEVISLSVFTVYALLYFKEMPTWRTLLAFVLIVIACILVMPRGIGRKPDQVNLPITAVSEP
jgi:uncharacterized protein (DUF486 family)